jgi:hypothetical protein
LRISTSRITPFGTCGKEIAKAKKLPETSLAAGRRKPMPSGLATIVQALYNYADWQIGNWKSWFRSES